VSLGLELLLLQLYLRQLLLGLRARGEAFSWRILFGYLVNDYIHFRLDLSYRLLLSFKAAPRLCEVNDEQKDSVVIVVAGFPRDLSHAHRLFAAEIEPEFREEFRVLGEGIAEEKTDCTCLLPDLVEFEAKFISQSFYLGAHNLKFDHFVHLLI
jgi:hypothetical protein